MEKSISKNIKQTETTEPHNTPLTGTEARPEVQHHPAGQVRARLLISS